VSRWPEWAAEPISTLWGRGEFVTSAGNRTTTARSSSL